jgi:hypothetical protein
LTLLESPLVVLNGESMILVNIWALTRPEIKINIERNKNFMLANFKMN